MTCTGFFHADTCPLGRGATHHQDFLFGSKRGNSFVKKLGMSLAGAALSGVAALSLATPALAESAHAVPAASPAVSADAEAGQLETRAYSRAQKIKRVWALTSGNNNSASAYMTSYAAWRDGKNPYGFDWKSDGCSGAADYPLGFNFKAGCMRHDFGYRNFKKLHAFSEANRLHVDKGFLWELTATCNTQWGKTEGERKACRKVAKKYYQAVRDFGRL